MVRAQPRPVVIDRPRPAWRVVVPRRVVVQQYDAAAVHPARRPAPVANAAVVNTSADLFATATPTGPTPIPVADKP